MTKLFGTDGVRGIANVELTNTLAYQLGQAAVEFLGKKLVVGRDTRISGDMLFSSLAAGIMSFGGEVFDAGIIPTPGIAFLCRKLNCNGGIVISASHNPPQYNGIKFFDAQGFKLSEDLENSIEDFVVEKKAQSLKKIAGDKVGTIISVNDACDLYINYVVSLIKDSNTNFSNYKIALDTAHGASSLTTAKALKLLGANVIVINDDFNGIDINVDCGSTHLDQIKKLVLQEGADIGVAHDGDADRVLFVDEKGNEIDGDAIEATCAIFLKEKGRLKNNTVVSTVMSNLGFLNAMKDSGINVEITAVGDRNVLERMREGSFSLGGEQSGHIIFLDHNSTGDGLITACLFLSAINYFDTSVSKATAFIQKYPQVLINVEVENKRDVLKNVKIAKLIDEQQEILGNLGRIVVRPSGTEPLVRVMVEASTQSRATQIAQLIAKEIQKEFS